MQRGQTSGAAGPDWLEGELRAGWASHSAETRATGNRPRMVNPAMNCWLAVWGPGLVVEFGGAHRLGVCRDPGLLHLAWLSRFVTGMAPNRR